jgi:hypothetical protein
VPACLRRKRGQATLLRDKTTARYQEHGKEIGKLLCPSYFKLSRKVACPLFLSKSTYWATFPKLHGEDATPYQMRGHGIDLYTGSIPVIRSYYPFTTRAEYKKINQDSGHK